MSGGSPNGPRHRWRIALLVETLLGAIESDASTDDPPIIDAGCGTGSLALQLAERGHRILAFDRDLDRVRETRARSVNDMSSPRVHVFVADAEAIPLREASARAAAAGEVLEHVARDDVALAEIERILEPGGALALTVPAGPERLGAFDRAWGHVRRYDAAGLRDRLQGAAFGIETQRAWGWPFGRVYDVLVQRPALRAQGGRAGGLLRGMGRNRVLDALWRGLFAVDERLVPWAGEHGSGWLVVGRKGEVVSGERGIQES